MAKSYSREHITPGSYRRFRLLCSRYRIEQDRPVSNSVPLLTAVQLKISCCVPDAVDLIRPRYNEE
ncbi:Protein of unknown function [Pyronema omphalodes CBS 100304]|uniref:Uncharacterized protein n=1 Tax=Pyronema omphalodes (strain CBS 100304) TaxID=1076935 RepID=U4LX96_PYROM|nr:Protein of unknown function [Pyronema omphalodes CBS 100304]